MLQPDLFGSEKHRQLLKDERVRREVSNPTKSQVLASGRLFIQFRWIAATTLGVVGVVASALDFPVPWSVVLALSLVLLAGNFLFKAMADRIGRGSEEVSGRILQTFNLGQVVLDWGVLLFLIHWTGGIESPTVYFFFVHLVMTSILQPMWQVGLMALVGVVVISGLFHLEALNVLPHHFLSEHQSLRYTELRLVWAVTAVLTAGSVSLVLLTRWVAALVRRRMVELAAVKVNLEDANQKRLAIVATIKTLGEAQELDALLEQSAREALQLWGIRGAAIGLWNAEEQKFTLGAVSGLEPPANTDPLDFVNRPEMVERMRQAKATIIPDVDIDPAVYSSAMGAWFMDNRQHSVLVMPLQVGAASVGVFLLTCDCVDRFGDDEVSHFRVYCDLLAAGIESARAHRLLLEHSRARNWFFHRVAHDLRSPVGAMRSMLSLVEEGYVTEPTEVRSLVTRVNQRAVLLESLVNDLLALAEDRMKAQTTESEPLDLSGVFSEICDLFRTEAEKKGVSFVGPEPPLAASTFIKANRQSIERVLNNLLSNAVKYTRPGGSVRVATKAIDSRVQIVVSDTGIGIPLDSQGHLFEEFFRARNARELTPIGTGLGLRITRNLVEEMSGTLRFTSVENEGSTFAITLPVIPSFEVSPKPST